MSLPATITIVGLGYGDASSRSLAAQRALDSAATIILRTAVHDGIEDLRSDNRVVACDDLYESSPSFDDVYDRIVERVMRAASNGPVVYAVPGSPVFGESTVVRIRDRAAGSGIPVEVIPAASALDAIAASVGMDLLSDQVQIVDALWLTGMAEAEPFSGSILSVDPGRPLVVGQVFNRSITSSVKHVLCRVFPEDHAVTLVIRAGVPDEEQRIDLPLCEIDHVEIDHLTSLVVPALPMLEAFGSASTLHAIIGQLRSPDGCPWDRKQSHETLRDKLLEEAHETVDAIDGGDPDELAGELGDLLLLVALHAQIAEEAGTFTIEDIYRHVNAKLVRRHPHVFGEEVARTPEEVLTTWRSVKAAERKDAGVPESVHRYEQLPRSMSVIQRIRSAEHRTEPVKHPDDNTLGDRLLELVSGAIARGIDPEDALDRAYRRSIAAHLQV